MAKETHFIVEAVNLRADSFGHARMTLMDLKGNVWEVRVPPRQVSAVGDLLLVPGRKPQWAAVGIAGAKEAGKADVDRMAKAWSKYDDPAGLNWDEYAQAPGIGTVRDDIDRDFLQAFNAEAAVST